MNLGINICDECGSNFLASSSKMANLCPNCSHYLHGYANCIHQMKDGVCIRCKWDGSTSEFIQAQIKSNHGE